MTNEEAIKQLYKIRKEHLEQVPNAWGTRNYYETKSPQIEALDMAIEELEDCDGVAEALNGYVELYRKLKEKYDNLKKQSQWIPCSERLPEVGEDVFISVGERVCEAHLRESKEYFLTHKAKTLIAEWEVDAWCELPKPYEGRKE